MRECQRPLYLSLIGGVDERPDEGASYDLCPDSVPSSRIRVEQFLWPGGCKQSLLLFSLLHRVPIAD